MAGDNLPSSYKFGPPPASGTSVAPPAPSANLPTSYKPPAAPAAAPPPPPAPPAPAGNSPPDPSAPAPGGYDLGPLHFGYTNRGTPGVSWQGGGWVPSSQTAHDVWDRLTNNAVYNAADPITSELGGGDLATLRAQREQMNAQMSPAAKATADIGAQFMPQNILLNRFGGPVAQGAVQQGVGSLNQGNDPETALKDAAIGAATGKVAQVAAGALNPQNMGWALGKGVENIPALVGLKFGGFGGGWAADKFSKSIVEPAARWTENAVNKVMPDIGPTGRSAVQSAILGGGQTALDTDAGRTAKQNLGGYAQSLDWNTARTALQNLRGMLPY